MRAFVVVTEVFDIRQLWDDIVAEQARPAVEYSMIAEVRRLLDRASRWFLANRQQPLAVDAEIARFRDHIRKHSGLVSDLLCGNELAAMRLIREEFVTKGSEIRRLSGWQTASIATACWTSSRWRRRRTDCRDGGVNVLHAVGPA